MTFRRVPAQKRVAWCTIRSTNRRRRWGDDVIRFPSPSAERGRGPALAWRSGSDGLLVGRRECLPLLQVITAAGLDGLVIRLLAVEEMRLAHAHHLGDVPANEDGRSLVETDAEELWIRLHKFGHVRKALALREMLVDGDAG